MDDAFYARRLCKGLCKVLDPDLGLCCGLCSTDPQCVQRTYEKTKRDYENGLRKNFTVIPALEITPEMQPTMPKRA